MKRRIVIVDNNDEVIGSKDRSAIDPDKDIYRASAFWLTNSEGNILLALRGRNKEKDPGRWGPAVSGTVDEGENYEDNIYKEAEEEIGLTGLKFIKGPKQRIRGPRNFFAQWYLATLDRDINDFTIQKQEVDEIKWISKEELEEDMKKNPSKYIPALPPALQLIYNS